MEEYFLIFDVPEQLSKRVKSGQLRTLKTQLSIPLKTYTSVLYKLCPVPPSHFHHKPRPTPTSLPASLPTIEPSISTDRNEKATKSDDSEIPYHLWRNHLSLLTGVNLTPDWEISANKLRQVLLGRWKRNVTSSFWTFLKKQCQTQPSSGSRSIVDMSVTTLPSGRYAWRDKVLYKKWHFTYQSTCYWNPGMECILRASTSSWWVWDQGSRPFFWNFDDEFILDAMYGNKPWIEGHLPRFQARQKPKENGDLAQLVASKFAKVRKLLYVKPTQAKSEIDCFWVPKGDDDLRIVYNGTSCGLNPVYWAPWFDLPTVHSQLRALLPGYSTGDADIGDMFHNFMQHPSVAPFIGINIIKYNFDYVHELKDLNFILEGGNSFSDSTTWADIIQHHGGECFWRQCMGTRPAPYNSCQTLTRVEEQILGEKDDLNNPFHWDHVRQNLPGMKSYQPSIPKVSKVRKDGLIAVDDVDDLRATGATREMCFAALQRIGSMLSHMGIQIASRKRRDTGEETGAWAGTVVHTSDQELQLLVSQEKWDKTKEKIYRLKEDVDSGNLLDFKDLESIRGFLIYVSRTYTSMIPYLKGLHQTISG